MKKHGDSIILAVNILLLTLVAVEFFTGGYKKELTYYNVWIARLWGFAAVMSLFNAIFSFGTGRPNPVKITQIIYSTVIFILIALIMIFQV